MKGVDYARVHWRCRRGMLELDLLLQRFLEKDYGELAENDRAAFARLLELPDNVLAGYLIGGEQASDPELNRIIGKIS